LAARCSGRRALGRIAALAAESFVVLLALLVAVYGLRALEPGFLLAQLEPLFLFGVTGMGALPIEWKGFGWALFPEPAAADMPCLSTLGLCAAWGEWHLFYQVVAPGVALATLGTVWRSSAAPDADSGRDAVLALHALLALLMSAKFMNMSIVALWQVNSLGFLVVLGWWWKELLAHATGLSRALVLAAGTGLLVLLAAFSRDTRNPTWYGWQSWEHCPSLVRVLRGYPEAGCGALACMANRPHPRDVALIAARVPPEEPAAMFDVYDWTYHIAARRAPLAPFLPSRVMFTRRQLALYRERVAGRSWLFIAADADGLPLLKGTPLEDWNVLDEYVVEARGERLLALRRKSAPGGVR
jgi:hypothetical protein